MEKTVPLIMGKTTVQNVIRELHPSIFAASSTSTGTDFTAPLISSMDMGSVMTQNAMLTPMTVLPRPNTPTITFEKVIMMHWKGTHMAHMMSVCQVFVNLFGCLVIQ